ncbi:MAG: polysaccharide biosynthesis/export family protein, partial [Muribaculaceae bacterium]|nr:polysaccharide biosynthesis/export family protein [Muribaculaceae bacterium]
MKLKTLALVVLGAVSLASCSSNKTVLPYFTDISQIKEGTLETGKYSTLIKPDDELLITITSSYPTATARYNLPLTNPATREDMMLATTPKQQTYVVNSKGDIIMPTIGTLHVEGMTTEALQEEITNIVKKDVADAIVRVQLINFQVIVAGEVSRPSTIRVNRNRFSILDALSAAGDLTPYGERSNIMIIREENGERKFAHLDLNSSDILTSPYFYLKQNDYIYVEPNDIRQANSRYNQDNAYKLTVMSTVVSAGSVIAWLLYTS